MAQSLGEETTFTTIAGLPRSVRTPVWQAAKLVCIRDQLRTPAVRLYPIQPTTVTTGAEQFRIVGACSRAGSVREVLGRLEWKIVVDCYGMRAASQALSMNDDMILRRQN